MDESKQGKTSIYGTREQGKTGAYNESGSRSQGNGANNVNATHAYHETNPQDQKESIYKLKVGQKILLRSKEYNVINIISEGTGEAIIYKIEDSYNKKYALKLYLEFNNPKEEPSYETLKRIIDISDPDILKLYDFGVGSDKYLGKYCYEISDFAEGGDLFSIIDFSKKYTPEFIEKKIIPELYLGISKLHELGIFHCDLKPSNIFYKDANQTDLVIGDYGSAKSSDIESLIQIRRTSTVKGTDVYLAPEQAKGMISEKNDYYSLGMILLQLVYPEQISRDECKIQIDKYKFDQILQRQFSSKPLVNYHPTLTRLNNLIAGLTLVSSEDRFGKSEVKDWLEGKILNVRYNSSEYENIIPVKLEYGTIWNEIHLLNIIYTHPKQWYEDLIEDKDSYSLFKRWLESYKGIHVRRKVDDMIRFYQPLGQKYVEQAILRFFKPDTPIRMDVHSYDLHHSKNLKSDVEAYINKLDEYWKSNSLEWIKFQIFLLEFTLRQLSIPAHGSTTSLVSAVLEKLFAAFGLVTTPFTDYKTSIQSIFKTKDETNVYRILLSIFYTYQPDRKFRDLKNKTYQTIEEMALFFAANDEDAYKQKILIAERETFLKNRALSQWISLELKDLIFTVFKGKETAQIDLISLTFDKKRTLKIEYRYFKSLDPFLSRNSISRTYTSGSGKNLIYYNSISYLYLFRNEFKKFTTYLTQKHGLSLNDNSTFEQLKSEFLKKSRLRLFYILGGRIPALCICIFTSYIILSIISNSLHVDNNWKFHTGNFEHNTQIPQKPKQIKIFVASTKANLRSRPSLRSSIIGRVRKGQTIILVKHYNSKWSYVKANGMYAYIFSAFIKPLNEYN